MVRVLRLVKRAKGLQTLRRPAAARCPRCSTSAPTLLLFFFIYAVMGMNRARGAHRRGGGEGTPRLQKLPRRHGDAVPRATARALERHHARLHDHLGVRRDSHPRRAASAGDDADFGELAEFKKLEFKANDATLTGARPTSASPLYFVSFILLCGFVMLNLVIAVILDNFESYSQSFALPVADERLRRLVEEWSKIDRRGVDAALVDDRLPELLVRIRAPLGLKTWGARTRWRRPCSRRRGGESARWGGTS